MESTWDRLKQFNLKSCQGLLDLLFEKEILSDSEIEEIEDLETPTKQWNKLLSLVKNRKQEAFHGFLSAVKEFDPGLHGEVVNITGTSEGNHEAQPTRAVNKELVRAVVNFDGILEAAECAKELGMKQETTAGLETVEQYRDAIFAFIKQSGRPFEPLEPPISTAKALADDFRNRRVQFFSIADDVERFCQTEMNLLEKLGLKIQSHLLTPKMRTEARNSCEQGTPSLLIAGTTSSGKSTLLNALLADNILPTSYNAATSAICEIRHSPDGTKCADVLWTEGSGEKSTERIDLTQNAGRARFAKCVNAHLRVSNEQEEVQRKCENAVIYWPFDFLRHFTLVDSPGVTEGVTNAREITETFQNNLATGFIYVLDASRAAEEAGEVGGLLGSISNIFPMSGAALFVLNKWDHLLSDERKREGREEFLAKVMKRLTQNWRGFKPEQLIKMNAKLTGQAGKLGFATFQLQSLCDGIQRAVQTGMHFRILRSLQPYKLCVDEICRCLNSRIRVAEMTESDRKKFQELQSHLLANLEISTRFGGEVATLRATVEGKLKEIAPYVATDLNSLDARKVILSCDCKTVDDLLHKGLTCSPVFSRYFDWLQTSFFREVKTVLSRLFKDACGKPRRILNEVENVARRTLDEGSAASVASWFGKFKLKIKRLWGKPGEEEYLLKVAEVSANDYAALISTMKKIIHERVTSVQVLYDKIPQQIREINEEPDFLKWKADKAIISKYKEVLKRCRFLQQQIARFMLGSNMHEFAAADIIYEDSPLTVEKLAATTGFARINVRLPRLGKVSMKVEKVTNETAAILVSVTESLRLIRNENAVKYLGSASFIEDLNTLGLLFEFLPFTLAEKIFSQSKQRIEIIGGNAKGKHALLAVLSGLNYLHEKHNLIHGNVVPRNIFVSDDVSTVKIGEVAEKGLPTARSILYHPPEVLLKGIFSLKSDIYSFGTLLWAVWCGKEPDFKAGLEVTVGEVVCGRVGSSERLTNQELLDSLAGNMPIALQSLMNLCWSAYPEKRPNVEMIMTTLDS